MDVGVAVVSQGRLVFRQRPGVRSGQPHDEAGDSQAMWRASQAECTGCMKPRGGKIHGPREELQGRLGEAGPMGSGAPRDTQRRSPRVVAMSGAWNLKALGLDLKL